MAVAITFKVGASNGNLGANGSVTATGLTTSGASLILISASVGNNSLSTVSGVTVNGNAATLGKRQVMPDAFSNVEVWWWWSPAALASVSVVVTYANSAGAGTNIDICEATGTDASSIGNVGGANGTSATSAATVACSSSGSVMYASSLNFGSSGTEAAGTNTTLLNAQNDGAGDFAASSINNQATSSGTSYTVTTTHTSGQWAMAVVEVKPAAAALTPNIPTASEPVRRPPQPTRQYDAEWSSSQPLGVVVIPPIKALHEAPQSARESRALRHEGIFQPVQPLRSTVIPVPKNFGDAPPYFQSRQQNPRMLQSGSAESLRSPVIPAPKQFGEAPSALVTRKRYERATALNNGEPQPLPIASLFPVTPHVSGRYFVDVSGTPRWISGMTVWAAMTMSSTEQDVLIASCVSNNINMIEFGLLWRDGSTSPFGSDPRGSDRVPFANNGAYLPFTTKLGGGTWDGSTVDPDYATTNSAYFAFGKSFVDRCAAAGIICLMFPSYTGADGAGGSTPADGWASEMALNQAAGASRMLNYGAFVATTFATCKNIWWGMGGDAGTINRGFSGDERDAVCAIVTGILSVGGQASGLQFGAEWATDSIVDDQTDFLNGVSGATLGSTGTIRTHYGFFGEFVTLAARGYATSPPKPCIVQEGPFYNEDSLHTGANTAATDPVFRFYGWAWVFGCTAGVNVGNGYIWSANRTPSLPSRDDWELHTGDLSATDLTSLRAMVVAQKWWLMAPTPAIITSNAGSGTGTNSTGPGGGQTTIVGALTASDGSSISIYYPPAQTGSITVDTSGLSGLYRARYYDYTNGTYTAIGGTGFTHSPGAGTVFTAPATNSRGNADQFIVLDTQTQAGVEVPDQVSRSQRASRAPFRVQNLDPLPGISAAPTATGGFDLRPADRRQSRSPQPPAGSDGVLTAGLVDWDPIVPMAIERLPKSARPSINPEPLPAPSAPQSTPGGFESSSPAARTFRAPSSAGGEAMPAAGPVDWEPTASATPARAASAPRPAAGGEPMPPPPFVPGGFEVAPAGARPLVRPLVFSAENLIIPPPPFPPAGFDIGPAIARALARLQVDQATPLPGAGVADWSPDVYGDLARAQRGRLAVDQDRFPTLAVVVLPPWGFEPEPPRTRSPVTDRRLVNGEPLRSPVAVLLTAWGYEPPPAPARGPRQDRRGVAGEPAPAPILAALTAWFDVSGATARQRGARPWAPGEPLPAAGPAAWVESAAPTLARGMPRGRAPAAGGGGEPLPLLVLAPWGWEPIAAARARAARNDARATEPAPSPIVAAPIGFDPTAPMSRALRARLAAPNEPLPRPFIPGPLQPWGYEPSRPIARVSFAWARMDTGGVVLVAFTHAIPRTRVGGSGSRSGRSGGSTGHGGSGGPTGSGRS